MSDHEWVYGLVDAARRGTYSAWGAATEIAARIKRMVKESYDKGWKDGHTQGYNEGHKNGYQQAQEDMGEQDV